MKIWTRCSTIWWGDGVGFLLTFFIKNGIRSRRTIWMLLLSLVPVGMAVLLLLIKPLLVKQGAELASLFAPVSFYFYLHFLLPLLAIFIGTAIIADEVEDRTLPYLLTRPVSRAVIMISKLLAGCITAGLILFISLGMTFTVMVLPSNPGKWFSEIPVLFRSGGVLLAGLLVYVPLFALLGALLKRPVLAGLFFTFGWESSVSFFPGNVKLFTIAHYLHVLAPSMANARIGDLKTKLLDIFIGGKQTSSMTAVLVLALLALVFTGLSILLLYIKEYRLEQEG